MAKYLFSKTDKCFYRYLEIEPNSYDKLVQLGVGVVDKTVDALIKCGYSDTLFRKDSPTLIKTSDLLLDSTYEYLFSKSITLEEYQLDLESLLGIKVLS